MTVSSPTYITLLRLTANARFVIVPNMGMINGKNPIKLVAINIAERISKTTATIPEMTLVKYKVTIIIAIRIRIILSIIPIFFFIV